MATDPDDSQRSKRRRLRTCPPDGSSQAETDMAPIDLSNLSAENSDVQQEEQGELARFHREPYARGGSFWADALRDVPRPTIETAAIEELAETLGKDVNIQEKLSADDEERNELDALDGESANDAPLVLEIPDPELTRR